MKSQQLMTFPVLIIGLVLSSLHFCQNVANAQDTLFDVTKYGAVCDGKTDIVDAFTKAFTAACESPTPACVVIPPGDYRLGIITLKGPCKSSIKFHVDGNLLAPPEIEGDSWVTFNYMEHFCLVGKGTFDGMGTAAWTKNDCHKNKKCKTLPFNLRFNFVKQALIEGITSKDSKSFNVNVLGCENITFNNFHIIAPDESPNTDGIHMGRSTGVNIVNSIFETGDDCISVGDGIQQLRVENVMCGPGHGISIGSLGGSPGEAPVSGVFIKNCTLTNTQNGVRIKTKPNSFPGIVTDIHFEDIIMNNVGNPIIIDQIYCPHNLCANKLPSKVAISKVFFKNIHGTSRDEHVITMNCSPEVPCQDVEIQDVDITYAGPRGPAQAVCTNVKPKIIGTMNPIC
ncbi:PG1 [Linum grandiflorum]